MPVEAPAIITERQIPKPFLEEFEDHIKGTLPMEKAQVELRQQSWARIMAAEGSCRTNSGLGQLAARIDPRLYFRWLHMNKNAPPHQWIDDLIADNPHLKAKGYRPRQNSLRHGFTFMDGKPISTNPGKVQT